MADSGSMVDRRRRALVVADGGLLTAGTSSVAIGLMLALWSAAGSPEANLVTQATSSILALAGSLTGIVAAWRLNRRRFDRFAVLGGVLGVLAVGLIAPLVGVVAWLAGLFLGLFTTWEFAGPAAVLAIAVTAFVVVASWAVADALADMRGRRRHLSLDRARIASAAVVALVSAGILIASIARPGSGIGDAAVFIMLGTAAGALAVAGALAGSRIAGRATIVHAPPR